MPQPKIEPKLLQYIELLKTGLEMGQIAEFAYLWFMEGGFGFWEEVYDEDLKMKLDDIEPKDARILSELGFLGRRGKQYEINVDLVNSFTP
jgi:hypothetical protein